MVVLALETATREGSLALWDHGVCHSRAGGGLRTHAERLPGEIIDWLAAHDRAIGDIDLLAVIAGPGSFTGLRIGIAAIQGLALPGGRSVVGVPTLEALAAGYFSRAPANAVVAACLDGQRGEVFLAAFEAAGREADEHRPLVDPMVGTPVEAAGAIRDCSAGRPVVLVGDGALKYAATFEACLPGVLITGPAVPMAETAAVTAARHPDRAVAPHALRPIYLRRPDVVLARDRARAHAAQTLPPCDIRRAAGPDDLSAVAALQRATFTNAWGAEAIRWELEHTDVARLHVMHEPQGVLVAYCACWMVFDELHINSLAVDVTWRRRGVARRLLRHVLGEAAADGARSATLEVRRSNEAARALYEGLGFRVEGERRDYYQAPREDALILWNRVLTLW